MDNEIHDFTIYPMGQSVYILSAISWHYVSKYTARDAQR